MFLLLVLISFDAAVRRFALLSKTRDNLSAKSDSAYLAFPTYHVCSSQLNFDTICQESHSFNVSIRPTPAHIAQDI